MTLPSYHHQEEFINRSRSLNELRKLGIEPYPALSTPSTPSATLNKKSEEQVMGDSEAAAAGQTESASITGRLMLFRPMGKNAFGQIQDDSGRIQVMFNRELTQFSGFDATLPESAGWTSLKILEKKIDIGDILGISGHLFRTHKGELTLYAKEVTLLCKTLLPLPDKHSGLTDKEVRYRKRWLDLITNAEERARFRTRSHILKAIRSIFDQADFLEVETPILQHLYGGAEARPFTTHLHAIDQPMFLRISLEIALKKLIIGGMERIYEIGKVFRNEGIDKTHNPEFTMLEAYAVNWDYNHMMTFVEEMIEKVVLLLFGTTEIRYTHLEEGKELIIDVKAPWKRLSMKESIKVYADIDVDAHSDAELRALVKSRTDVDAAWIDAVPRGLHIATLFDALVTPHLIQPHHIIDHPIETTPLCKLHRDPQLRAEGIVERFESFLLGRELCNAYTELNDPELQRKLLEDQATKRIVGDELPHPMDEEFLEAICQGMPPTAGIGIGIDRLVMLLTDAHSIRDVLFFPIMKSAG